MAAGRRFQDCNGSASYLGLNVCLQDTVSISTVFNALQSPEITTSGIFPFIADAKNEMLKFKRDLNKLAHELAAYARRTGGFITFGTVPDDPP